MENYRKNNLKHYYKKWKIYSRSENQDNPESYQKKLDIQAENDQLESELKHNRQQFELARKDHLEKMIQVGIIQGEIENLLDELDILENYDRKRAN